MEELDGYRIYVYSPAMIACEKLRAICQQMEEYSPIVMRSARGGTPRARDFFDIHVLVDTLKLDMTSPKLLDILQQMFELKRVPLSFLDRIPAQRAFHAAGAKSLEDTIAPGVKLESFDFYFDYVVELSKRVQAALADQKPAGT